MLRATASRGDCGIIPGSADRRYEEAAIPFDQHQRTSILRERAADYVRVALANVTREYPHMPAFVATAPEDYQTHRRLHPAFYGAFDWHSCVEMHWVVVRLLRRFPDAVPASDARATLGALL